MKIERKGSFADHGTKSVSLDDASISWNAGLGVLEIKKDVVRDFNTEATHDYAVSLSMDELSKIIAVVLNSIESKSGQQILEMLRPHTFFLQRAVMTIVQPFQVPTQS